MNLGRGMIRHLVLALGMAASANVFADKLHDEKCVDDAEQQFPKDQDARKKYIRECMNPDSEQTSSIQPSKHHRDNWYIEFALYPAGDVHVSTSGGDSNHGLNDHRTSRVGLQFGVGATMNSKLLLGGEINSFAVEEEKKFGLAKSTGTLTSTNLMGVATYFPWEEGLFLRGGLGHSSTNAEVKVSGLGAGFKVEDSISGYGLLAGLGYAWWVGKTFNMSVKLDYSHQFYNDKIFNSDYKVKEVSFYALGVGFHWY